MVKFNQGRGGKKPQGGNHQKGRGGKDNKGGKFGRSEKSGKKFSKPFGKPRGKKFGKCTGAMKLDQSILIKIWMIIGRIKKKSLNNRLVNLVDFYH